MKQKIEIEINLSCERKKRKAIRIAVATTPGSLDMWAVEGNKSNKLVVAGDDVDAARLVSVLRKKVGPANILRVEAVDAAKNKEISNPRTHAQGQAQAQAHYQEQAHDHYQAHVQAQVFVTPAFTEPAACIVM